MKLTVLLLSVAFIVSARSVEARDADKMSMSHEEKEDAQPDKPSLKTESWSFTTDTGTVMVRYNRLLNRSSDGDSKGLSLPNTDYGIGFDGGPFSNWYRQNTIRVLIDGVDIMAKQPAKSIEDKEGENGCLQFTWEIDEKSALVLKFLIPPSGKAIFAMVDLSSFTFTPGSVQIIINAYPGGFAPAYHQPSDRWVKTAGQSGEVPAELAGEPGKFPKLSLASGEDWVFYADKITNNGALGLLLLADEKPSGEIQMSSYNQPTTLTYPAGSRVIHLGFYAFKLNNDAASDAFLDSLPKEREQLKAISLP